MIKIKQFEIIILSLLVLILPSLETPKTVFWAVYLLLFLIRRFQEHGAAFNIPNAVTLSAISLFLVSLISTLVNWPIPKGLSGAMYSLSYVSLFLCVYYAGYSTRQIKTVILFAIFGVLAGLLYGFLEYTSGISINLGFHSVGVTTQSSIYLGILIITAFGLFLDPDGKTYFFNTLTYISLLIMLTALLYMGSRGALIATFTAYMILLVMNFRWQLLVSSTSVIVISVFISFLLISAYPTNMNHPDRKERFSTERFHKSDNERIENWKIAVAKLSTGKDLVWGIGPHNYQTIDPRALGIESSFYKRTGKLSHAHNLFLTQLIEQGIAGLLSLLIFFLLVSIRLKNSWAYCRNFDRRLVWAAGIGSLTIPVIAGMFNTPFYREHAMLAMILLGAFFSETETETENNAKS